MRNKLNNITIRQIFLNHEAARSLDTNPVQFYYVVVVKSPAEVTKKEIRKTILSKNKNARSQVRKLQAYSQAYP